VALIDPRTVALPRGERCTIRCVTAADAPALIEHQGHMVQTDPNTVSEPGDKRRTLEEWTELLEKDRADPWSLALVAVQPPDPLILGGLAFHGGDRRKVRHHGYFGISIHADWRGRGVGSALIRTMLDWAAAHPDIEKVCLGVFATNIGAQRLYHRLGFRQEHVSPMHFKIAPGKYVDDIWMALYVKPGLAPPGFETWRS
jgi:RimJ/RimL family protein N-acetyltransferase